MPPVGVGASRFASALETGEAKLWIVLLGVNAYQDTTLPPLRYAALDCQGLGEALSEATQAFPQKECFIYHDFAPEKPTLEAIRSSLRHVAAAANTQDTVLLYFSGHGVLDLDSQQTVLCVTDTDKTQLTSTGLCLHEVLSTLASCAAHSQLLWLDACHSGNITLSGARGHDRDPVLLNPTTQLLELLRQRAAKSRGFYALLSCDQGQQSWEFPDLGHGVFSYFLMRGLRGEAAGMHGIIDADGLYRYIYHQTLQYIEQTNQQLRLVNQQKRTKGETDLHPEYSLQTPKRIVEGVGEIILGLKPSTMEFWQQRQGLMIDGLGGEISSALCEVLRQDGNFELQYVPASFHEGSEHRIAIADFLQQDAPSFEGRSTGFVQDIATRLLYLRGRIETPATEDAVLWVGETARISRAWLRQELRRSRSAQQIVILDCAGATTLEDWVEDLKVASDHGQCILACASPLEEPDLFAQVLLEALIATPAQAGLSMAGLLAKLQTNLDGLGLNCHLWLSGTQGLIEMLPSTIGISAQAEQRARSLQAQSEAAIPVPTESSVFEREAFLDRLEAILLSLVGPIAPALLAQVESHDPQGIITDLIALMPLHQRSEFERQAQEVLQSEQSSLSVPAVEFPPVMQGGKAAMPVAHASVTATEPPIQTNLDFEQNSESIDFDAIEKILREIIGPIASTLIAQLPPTVRTVPDVINELSSYLALPQRQRLETQMKSITESQASQPPMPNRLGSANGRGAATLEPRSIPHELDESFIQLCEQELTRLIGPIAQFIVTTTRETHAQVSRRTFVECLMDQIPDPTKAHEFRQRVL
jgi:uncharacterized caspase-like protein